MIKKYSDVGFLEISSRSRPFGYGENFSDILKRNSNFLGLS